MLPKWRGWGSVACSALAALYIGGLVFGCIEYDCTCASTPPTAHTDRIGICMGICICGYCIRGCLMVGCIVGCIGCATYRTRSAHAYDAVWG